jgi:hypothetical protein
MIRARIFRDGPGVWSFRILDKYGDPMVLGNANTWIEACDAAAGELKIFAGDWEPTPLISPAARERSWLARVLCGAAR